MNFEEKKKGYREFILNTFSKDGVIDLTWILETSHEDNIISNFEEDFGEKPNDSDWDEINDTITNFEAQYHNIVGEYVNGSITECGHDSNNALIGGAEATLKEVVNIMESGESVGVGEIAFTSTSGSFNRKELELLHQAVDTTLTFLIPEELVDAIEWIDAKELRKLIKKLK